MLGLLQLEWEPKCVNLCPDVGIQMASVMHNRPAFLTINHIFSSVLVAGISGVQSVLDCQKFSFMTKSMQVSNTRVGKRSSGDHVGVRVELLQVSRNCSTMCSPLLAEQSYFGR